MPVIPTNRGFARLRQASAVAASPSRVQVENYGTKEAEGAASGRPSGPRPALSSAPVQGREVFSSEKLDGPAMARALNSLQTKIAESTAQARSSPLAEGRLFQGVPLGGTLATGNSSLKPSLTGLPQGFLYFDTDLGVPLWLSGANWVDYQGAIVTGSFVGELDVIEIDHGFGSPAEGVVVTNVRNALIGHSPVLVRSGDSSDNNKARISLSYSPTGDAPVADFYLYR